MGGFEKIDLTPSKSTKNEVTTDSTQDIPHMATRKKRSIRRPKHFRLLIGITVVFLLFLIFGIALPAQRTFVAAMKTQKQAKLFATAMKQQNVELASVELGKTKVSLKETQDAFKSLVFLKYIPLAGGYVADADHMLKAGDYGLQSTEIVIESIKPYADVLGLKGQGSFVMGSAEDRIKTAVSTMGKITPRIDDISDKLILAKKEIDEVNPKRYPKFLFGDKVQTQLVQLQTLTDQGVAFVDEARPLIKVLPELLGEKEEKKYLILFQNDKELRATGGFITAYAIFKVDKGNISVETSDDIYKLDDSVRAKEKAPGPIRKYLPQVSLFNLRDSNLSPDFVESMKVFKEMYERASLAVDVDGIIALDTHVLVSTIRILDGSIVVNGQTFNVENDERCDCPQVIYALENDISRPVNYVKTDRKGLLGDMLFALMKKAMTSSPKLYWGPLFQSMLTQVNQKHVQFYLYNEDAQAGAEALNAAGRIRAFEGDYLHINDTNFGGAKSNLFVTQAVENSYEVKKDGTIVKTIIVDYKNPKPPSNCNLEAGLLCLNAELRDWVRVYVPKGSKLIDSKGSTVTVTTNEDLGKTVFEGFVRIRPLGSARYTLSYQLPFKVKSGSPLPLMIQKQAGTDNNAYTVKVNGKTIEEFPLLTDKEMKLLL